MPSQICCAASWLEVTDGSGVLSQGVCVCVHYDVLDVLKVRGPADEDTTD